MKILHVITLSELGGAQSVLLNLVKHSINDGHEVMVASSADGDLWNELPIQAHRRKVQSLQRAISIVKDWTVIADLKRIHTEFKPDVIHLHSSKIGLLGRLAFPSKKIIYTVHGFDSIRIAYRKFLYLEKLMQYKARHIVAVSQYDYNNLIEEGIQHNVSCIHNGISDFTRETTIDNDPTLVQTQKILKKSKKFKVLCIARLAAPKRFDLFCQIAERLSQDDIEFFWVGNKQVVSPLPDNIQCLGEITNAHRLLPHSNVFILPSDYEGLPISILEALCYGIPVVASNVGGISEALNSGNGYALKNEAQFFAQKILDYKNNEDIYSRAKVNARKSYLNEFSIHKMYKSYLELYKSAQL